MKYVNCLKTSVMKKTLIVLIVVLSNLNPLKSQTVDTNFPEANNQVYAVLHDSLHNYVFAGGEFTLFGGSPRQKFAVMNATTGALQTWAPVFDGAINDFIIVGNFLYVVGNFTHVDGFNHDHIAKFNILSKTLLSWNPAFPATGAKGLEYYNGKIYVYFGGNATNNIYRIDTSAAASISSWHPNVSGYVNHLKVKNNFLYVGGSFTQIDGQARTNIAAFDLGTSTPTLDSWAPDADSRVNCIEWYNGNVYVSGNFSYIAGSAINYLAEITDAASGGATLGGWNPNPSYEIQRIRIKGDQLYYFTYPSPLREVHLPTHTTTTWSVNFSSNFAWDTYGFDISYNKAYIGGGWSNSILGVSKKYFGVVCVNPYSPILGTTYLATYPYSICRGAQNMPFTVNNDAGATSYTWAITPTEVIHNYGDSATINFSANTANPSYILSITGSNGCVSTNTATATVTPYDFSSSIATQYNPATCGSKDTLIAYYNNYGGTGTLAYTWSPSTLLNTTSGDTVIATIHTGIKYHLTTTSGEGCVAKDSVTIVANPVVVSAPFDHSLECGQKDTLLTTHNYTGNGTITYSWAPSTGLSATNTLSPLATPVTSTNYTLTMTTSEGCVTHDTVAITVGSFSITAPLTYNYVCGESATLSAANDYQGNGTLSYTWAPSTALSSASVSSPLAQPVSTTNYTLTVADPAGCSSTAQVVVNVDPLLVSTADSVHLNCGFPVQLNASSNSSNANLHYNWSPASGLSNAAIFNPTVNVQQHTTYTVTVSIPSSACTSATDVSHAVLTAPVVQQICLVTVDSAQANHNIIVWEKQASTTIDSFYIYREITTNNYQKIGSRAYDSLSEFHDHAANPNTTGYRYKITQTDSCGFESTVGLWHNTIHLQYLGNGNLQWSAYNIEGQTTPVTSYNVYRDDNMAGNFNQIGTTTGNQTSYSDVNYSNFPNARYRVDVAWSIGCSPTRGAINTSRSNIKTASIGMQELVQDVRIHVSPNPFNETIRFDFEGQGTKNYSLEIMDALGRQVVQPGKVTDNKAVVNTEHLSAGIYFYRLSGSAKLCTGKIVKE